MLSQFGKAVFKIYMKKYESEREVRKRKVNNFYVAAFKSYKSREKCTL